MFSAGELDGVAVTENWLTKWFGLLQGRNQGPLTIGRTALQTLDKRQRAMFRLLMLALVGLTIGYVTSYILIWNLTGMLWWKPAMPLALLLIVATFAFAPVFGKVLKRIVKIRNGDDK